MASLGQFIIKDNEWKNVADLITLEDGKTYSIQVQNSASIAFFRG